jgi:hypothetical protein
MVALALVAGLVARGRWPEWVAVALAAHVALHGFGRLPPSIWFGSPSPGLVTGLVLCLPLALYAFARAARTLPRAELRKGLLVGVASFQPLWHFILLPVLPGPPA